MDVRRATGAAMAALQAPERRRNGVRSLLLLTFAIVLLAGAQGIGRADHGAWRDLVSLLGLATSVRLLVWVGLGEPPPLRRRSAVPGDQRRMPVWPSE